MSSKPRHALDISSPSKRGLLGSPSVPSKPFDLLTAAREFAETLSQLLNATVCNSVRLSAVTTPKGDALCRIPVDQNQPDAKQGISTAEVVHLSWPVVSAQTRRRRPIPCGRQLVYGPFRRRTDGRDSAALRL